MGKKSSPLLLSAIIGAIRGSNSPWFDFRRHALTERRVNRAASKDFDGLWHNYRKKSPRWS
jgi:hypothetical protein